MSEKKLTREADTSTLYEFESVPKPSLLVPLSLQRCTSKWVVGVSTIHYHAEHVGPG